MIKISPQLNCELNPMLYKTMVTLMVTVIF